MGTLRTILNSVLCIFRSFAFERSVIKYAVHDFIPRRPPWKTPAADIYSPPSRPFRSSCFRLCSRNQPGRADEEPVYGAPNGAAGSQSRAPVELRDAAPGTRASISGASSGLRRAMDAPLPSVWCCSQRAGTVAPLWSPKGLNRRNTARAHGSVTPRIAPPGQRRSSERRLRGDGR